MGRVFRLALLLASVGCGSWSTTFRPTDPTFAAHTASRDPDVFVDKLPLRRYVAAGFIEVRAPSNEPMRAFVERALPTARDLGCELLVARHLYLGLAGPRLVAQAAAGGGVTSIGVTPPPLLIGGEGQERRRRDFVCGMYVP